ncbi:hypothetical protein BJY52DRAFT_1192312 [Lactarius psammicola]|nr:hypothetical protein BJY52DRAFT_1192312 [Lactarius psammicola]
MSCPFLALSVNTRQLRTRSDVLQPAEDQDDFGMDGSPSPQSHHSFRMDGSLSPQSQRSFGMDGSPSPQSHHSFRMDGSPSPQSQCSFGMDGSPSPQSQLSFSMGASPSPQLQTSFGMDGSPSPQGQQSFNMDRSPSLDGREMFGMDMPPLPEVQDQGTDPAPTQQAATLRMEAPLEIEAHQSSINAAPAQKEKLRDVPLPTEAGEAFGRPSAACTWNWGQRAPSPSSTEMQDQVGSTSDAHQGEVPHLPELGR